MVTDIVTGICESHILCLCAQAALVRSTMESLQHIDRLGLHLKVGEWNEPNGKYSHFWCEITAG